MLENAPRLCGASFGNLLLCDGDTFRRVALYNAPPAWEELTRRDPVRITGSRRVNSSHAGGALYSATRRNVSPSHSSKLPKLAPQSRGAFSSIVGTTGPS